MAIATKNVTITPKFAREIVTKHNWFLETNSSSDGFISRKSFLFLIATIGASFDEKAEDFDHIIQKLERIAQGEITAGVPGNISTLINEYDQYLEARIKSDNKKAQEIAEGLDKKIEKERTNKEVAKIVFDAAVKNDESPQNTQKPTIPAWMEQELKGRVDSALNLANIPEEIAKKKSTELITEIEKIKASGIQPTRQGIEDLIKNVFPDSNEGQKNIIETAILPAFQQPGAENVFSAYDKSPRPSFRTATPSIKPQTQNPNIETQTKPDAELSKSSENILFLLTQRRVENVVLVQNQILGKSTQEQNRQQLETALFYLQSHEPGYYKENQGYFEQIRQNMATLANVDSLIEKADFLTENQLKEIIADVDSQTHNLFRLDPSSQTNSIIATPQSINRFQQLVRLAQFEQLEMDEIYAQETSRYQESAPTFHGGSMIGRASNFIGRGFNTQQLARGGATRGITSLLSAGGVVKAGAINGARALGTFLATLAAPEIAAGAGLVLVVCLVFGLLFFLSYKNISDSQSIFIKQTTSAGIPTQSQYFSLTKTVSPNSYQGELPTKANYTVTLTAKDKNIVNISATDVFTAYGEKNPPSPSVPLPTFPSSLEAGKSIKVEFPLDIGTNYKDSVIVNTFTVTADIEGGPKAEKSVASATLLIGVPNVGCFTIIGDNWPPGTKEQVMVSIATISKFPAYVAGVCKNVASGSSVVIDYNPDTRLDYGGIVHGTRITLTPKAFYLGENKERNGCLFYTFSHETGHVFANKNSDIYTKFRIDVNPPTGEAYIPSYVFGKEPSEDFAESASMYMKRQLGDHSCSGVYQVSKMETISPLHYNFWKDYIK